LIEQELERTDGNEGDRSIRSYVADFSADARVYRELPERYKRIAQETAIEVIALNEEHLLSRATGLDMQARQSPSNFVRVEWAAHGDLVSPYSNVVSHLLSFHKRASRDDAEDYARREFLRPSVALRLAHMRLADAMEYQEGRYESLVMNSNFQTATELTVGAVQSYFRVHK